MANAAERVYALIKETVEEQGVSLWEFTAIMHYLGVENAINFDGGGSTTLYAEGEGDNVIVNHPSDNKKVDRQGDRHVVNALLFIQK